MADDDYNEMDMGLAFFLPPHPSLVLISSVLVKVSGALLGFVSVGTVRPSANPHLTSNQRAYPVVYW